MILKGIILYRGPETGSHFLTDVDCVILLLITAIPPSLPFNWPLTDTDQI